MSAHIRIFAQHLIMGALIGLIGLGLGCGKKEQETEQQEAPPPEVLQPQVVQAYGKLPLSFTENRGQVAEPVRFYIRGSRGSVFFTPQEVVYDIVEKSPQPDRKEPGEMPGAAEPDTSQRRTGVVVRMKLLETDPDVILEGVGELEGKVNIFRGKDPDKWKTGIRTFSGIVYRNLYSGIDLYYRGQGGRLTSSLTVSPRGEIADIVFHYEGAGIIAVGDDGRLRIETAVGTITEPKPRFYQEKNGQQIEIKGGYRMIAANTVGLETGRYDRKLPLIVSIEQSR